MSADWVAASVRARSLAMRRIGAGASYEIASQPSLADGLRLLDGTVYAERLVGCTSLGAAERATRETVLWQLRVLAGWVPATGTRLVRAAAATFERENILDLAESLDEGRPAPEAFDVGSLSTAWTRLRTARSLDELTVGVRSSPWGEGGSLDLPVARDELTIVSLRRLAAVAPAARPWAEAASALIVARIVFVDRSAASRSLTKLVRPFLGETWEESRDLRSAVAAFPHKTQALFRDATNPKYLWRAEAGLRALCESDGFRLLRGSLPGPDIVLGIIVVLAMDAWRVRAALASASAGLGSSEVLDVVA